LLTEIPKHRDTISQKIASLQGVGPSGLATVIKDVGDELDRVNPLKPRNVPSNEPVPVVVHDTTNTAGLQLISAIAGHIIETVATTVLVIALVIFMLIYREDLRNRAIRLMGTRSLTSTTRAMDEAASRISRFLTLQVLVNVCFAVALSLGLTIIGVPYPLAWGLIIGLLRFLP